MRFVEDLQNIDWERPGEWPLPIQGALYVVVFVAILVFGWYTDFTKQIEALVVVESKEVDLLSSLEIRQKKAAMLEPLKEQLAEMEQSFGDMLKQLPDKAEVATLLVDISQTGVAAGLEFQLFKPQQENLLEFYTELPIEIKVVGGYHQFGEFISGLASQPRIVTMHDIEIGRNKNENGGLLMKLFAKTYRAIGEDEADAASESGDNAE